MGIQPKMLDPDSDTMNPDPKHCLLLMEHIPCCLENGGWREQAEGEEGEVQQAAPPRPGRRYRLHQREEHEVQPEAREVRYSPIFFCRECASIGRKAGEKCAAAKDSKRKSRTHLQPYVLLYYFFEFFLKCPFEAFARWVHVCKLKKLTAYPVS